MLRYQKIMRLSLAIFAMFVVLYGCGRSGAGGSKDVIAKVNNDAIYRSDLKKEIAVRASRDPLFRVTPETKREQLEAIINRKLIVQAAMDKGLARREQFVETIKSFWEQTLIRNFIKHKKEEFQKYLFVAKNDIKTYYNNLSMLVTFKVFKSTSKEKADNAYDKYLRDKDTSEWQTVGPLAYENVLSHVLLEAFEMDQGQVGGFEDIPDYYLIQVVSKEKMNIEPLEEMQPEIEKRILQMKEKVLFDDWLKERRKRSKVDINKEFLAE